MFCRTELYGCFGELYGSFHRQESHYVLSTGYNEVAQETGAVFAHRPIQHFNTTSTQSLTPTQHGQSLSLLRIKMMSVNLSHLWLVWRSVTSLELETTVSQSKISFFLLKKLKTYKSVSSYRFAILSVKSTNQNHFPRWIAQCFIVDCFQARCSLAIVIR